MNNTLIVLIDFYGHPPLGGEYTNNLRYTTLLNMAKHSNSKNTMVVSNETSCAKMQEIRKITGIPWHDIKYTDNIDITVVELAAILLDEYDFVLSPNNTTVIVGGTNTSGCVLHNKNISVAAFGNQGFKAKMYLPLCAEYEIAGVNDIEKNMNSFGEIYRYLKKNDLVKMIDVVTKY